MFLCTVSQQIEHIANYIMLLAKQYIYTCRCLKKNPNKFELYKKFRTVQSYELYHAKTNNTVAKYCKRWCIPKNNEIQSSMDFITKYINETLVE